MRGRAMTGMEGDGSRYDTTQAKREKNGNGTGRLEGMKVRKKKYRTSNGKVWKIKMKRLYGKRKQKRKGKKKHHHRVQRHLPPHIHLA